MADPGTQVAFVATVRAEPVRVATAVGQSLVSGGSYFDDVQVVPVGPTTFRVTRRYVPQWAIIVGIVGALLCLVGALVLLVRNTEELVVDVQPDPEGSRVVASGISTGVVVTTLGSVLARFDGYAPATLGGTVAVPADAPRSPDGFYWWDGVTWRPVPGPPTVGT